MLFVKVSLKSVDLKITWHGAFNAFSRIRVALDAYFFNKMTNVFLILVVPMLHILAIIFIKLYDLQGGDKVLVTGPWYAANSSYSVIFGTQSVPATLLQSGVLRCFSPGKLIVNSS